MTDQTATEAAPDVRDVRYFARVAIFFAFAALILLGPFAAQVLGSKSRLFRPWTMFSAVGVGIPKGEFIGTAPDGSVRRLTPLQVLGIDRYPVMLSFEYQTSAKGDGGLRKFASDYCAKHGGKLSFRGYIGSRQGWHAADADDLCASR
jgi:hypothetical protein